MDNKKEQEEKEGKSMRSDPYYYVPERTWFTAREACQIKGICLKTAYNNRKLMPNKGVYDGKVGGRKVFHRNSVLAWLNVTDEYMENE